MQARTYNWKPSPQDDRDIAFKASRPRTGLPESADIIRPKLPPALDQGDLGSCVAHATALAAYYGLAIKGAEPFVASRLAIYHDARLREGTVDEDAGCFGRDAIKSIMKNGIAPERLWPYEVGEFTKKPPREYYSAAGQFRATRYERVRQTLPELKYSLFRGYPICFGIQIFESFESDEVAKTGIVPMPTAGEPCYGGHEILMIGYDDARNSFRFRNSWGTWGDDGDGWLPYQYALDPKLADDFQTFWM